MLLDCRLSKGASFIQAVPKEWNGFAYVYQGQGNLSGTKANIEQVSVLKSHMLA